ncbi:class I adenylate-forming enzyme family protein [Frankia sp. CiP3]|uniref:class I adenylate-forming enzyme family protein n=1 Tax=Frankia sp. CiP3 TaxID=2880971 RepID=UPI001EF4F61D|nr:fatty acid--CoA ligase family protein [Frankia sp. CiP3]
MSTPSWRAPLRELLVSTAARHPLSLAVRTPTGTSATFGQLATASEELSRRLEPGTRTGVRLGNDLASLVAVHAVWRAGGSVVSLSRLLPDAAVTHRARDAGCATIVEPDPDGLGARLVHADAAAAARNPLPDEALIIFTSGTTGRPKGAAIAFSALEASIRGIAAGSGLPPQGRPVRTPAREPQPVFVPVAHMGGFLTSLTSWWLGKPVLLCHKFSVELVARIAAEYRIGVLRLTPSMVYELVHADTSVTLPEVSSVTVGTAPLPEATRVAFEARYGVPVLRNYGQTEFAGAIAFERPDDVAAGRRPAGSVGRAAPGVAVRIVDTDGAELPRGRIGEIQARASSAMSGYLDDDGRVRGSTTGGWIATGDLGTVDADGFVSVVGRVRDLILCGGFNVYPTQVENALNRIDGVRDSAVAAVADDRLGEVPSAVVVGAPALTEEALRRALRAELAPYELPRRIRFVGSIPRLDTGKVDRAAVVALLTTEEAAS